MESLERAFDETSLPKSINTIKYVCIGDWVFFTGTVAYIFLISILFLFALWPQTDWPVTPDEILQWQMWSGWCVVAWLEQEDMWSVRRSHQKGFQIYCRNGISVQRTHGLFSQRGLLTPPASPTVEMWAVVSRMICTCVKSKSPPGPLPGFPRLPHWASLSCGNTQKLAAQHHKLKTRRKEWQRNKKYKHT